MAGGNGQAPVIDPSNVAATVELARMVQLLGALLAATRGKLIDVSVTDGPVQEMVMDDFPVAGLKRVLVRRTGNGTDGTTVPTTGVSLLFPNEGRLGMTWVNSGASPIILYLSDQKRSGVPAIWLAASGGSWDGRFGGATWGGNVFAVAQTAQSTIVGGEF